MTRRSLGWPALAAGLTALAVAQAVGQGRGTGSAVVAAAGTAAVALAGRRPLTATSVVAASAAGQVLLEAGDPVFGTFLALMATSFGLGRHAPQRVVAVGTAAVAAAIAVVVVRDGSDFLPVELVFPLVYLGGAVALGRLVRGRELAATAAVLAARREADAREAAALADERARIAREMHDVVAHAVSLLVVQAESAAAVLPTDPARATRQLERVADSGRQALDDLRRLLGVLRTDAPDGAPQPTLRELEQLAESVRSAGRQVRLRLGPGLDDVPAGLQLAAYRVVQEALTNAVRHGSARHVDVRVERRDGALEVEVVDDGTGGPVSTGGHGLTGMRERLRLYDGRLDAGPQPSGGWRVVATAPVTPA